jgi:hypothetical protein
VLQSGKRVKRIFFPDCWTRGRGIFLKKTNFSPECCTQGRGFFKKKWQTAPTASNLPRVLGRHSGTASPSVRFLALREGLFTVRGIAGSSSPSIALREGFPECYWAFPECIWHSRKHTPPVVEVCRHYVHFSFSSLVRHFQDLSFVQLPYGLISKSSRVTVVGI